MLGLAGFREEMESVGEGIQMGPRLHTLCSSALIAASLTLLAFTFIVRPFTHNNPI